MTFAEHQLDQTVEHFFELMLERLLALSVVELRAERSGPDDELEDVLQALHRLRQLDRVQSPVLDALHQNDEQLAVRKCRVKVLIDVEL